MTSGSRSWAFESRNCPLCSANVPVGLFELTPAQFLGQRYRNGGEEKYGIPADRKFAVVRCGRCAFVYAARLPPTEFAALLYDTPSADDYRDPGAHPSLRPGWVAQQLKLATALLQAIAAEFGAIRPSILDYGCGFGTLVRTLHGPTANCIGLETSAFMADYLRSQGFSVVTSLTEVAGPLHGVILSDVLEHLPEPRAVLRQLRPLLVPTGFLCLNVPNFNETRLKRIAQELASGKLPPQDLHPWEHLNYFSPESLRHMLREEGFTPTETGVDIGLRPGLVGAARLRNAAMSMVRLAAYALSNKPTTTFVLARPAAAVPDALG